MTDQLPGDLPRAADLGGVGRMRGSLGRAIRLGALLSGAAALLLMVVGWLVDGSSGLLGALVGAGLASVFMLVTAVVAWVTARSDPLIMAGVMVGSWLVKMVVVIVVLALAVRVEAIGPLWIGIGMIAGLLTTLVTEYRVVTAARIPYVSPTGSD